MGHVSYLEWADNTMKDAKYMAIMTIVDMKKDFDTDKGLDHDEAVILCKCVEVIEAATEWEEDDTSVHHRTLHHYN